MSDKKTDKPFWKRAVGAFVQIDDAQPGSAGAEGTEDIEALLAEVRGSKPAEKATTPAAPAATAPTPTAPTPAAPAPAPVTAVAGDVAEGRPFDDIYKSAGVPSSPHSAEKLLKVLDGLASMPVDTRRQVVAAMDAADDTWAVADPVLDAQHKVGALQAEKARLVAAVKQAEEKAAADNKAQDDYLASATTEIRRQIEELQKTLESEVAGVTQAKGEIDARLRATREAAARETARLPAKEATVCARLVEMGEAFEELYHRINADPTSKVADFLSDANSRLSVEEELSLSVEDELEDLQRRRAAASTQGQRT